MGTDATDATDAHNVDRFKSLVVLGRRPKEVGGGGGNRIRRRLVPGGRRAACLAATGACSVCRLGLRVKGCVPVVGLGLRKRGNRRLCRRGNRRLRRRCWPLVSSALPPRFITGLRPGHPHYEDCFPDDALSLSLTDSLALWTVSSGFCSSLSRQSPSDRSLSVFSESLSEIFERSLFKYQMSHVLGYRMSLGPCQSNPSCATSRSPSPQRFAGFFAMSTSTFIHIYMPISISISISIDICVHIDIDIDIALPAFLLARALVHVVTITTASVYNAKDDPLVLEACTQIE